VSVSCVAVLCNGARRGSLGIEYLERHYTKQLSRELS
jgi:hypothetical protein